MGAYSKVRNRMIVWSNYDGGNGGRGGDLYLVGNKKLDNNLSCLSNKVLRGNKGRPGKSKIKHGDDGKDLFISVPLGTSIYSVKELKDQIEP